MTTMTGNRDSRLRETAGRRVQRVLWVTAAMLLVPAVAMRFTAEVNWGPMDFAVAAVLLAGTGLVYELAVQRIGNRAHRIVGGLALAGALLLAWAELAVGVFH
jgi:hypothetical protein